MYRPVFQQPCSPHRYRGFTLLEMLVVLVIGESARADHWHINGYGRSTTPRLEALEGAQVYPHVRAVSDCTYTAVPALLKLMGARAYRDSGFGAGVPTMLDYFKAAGFLPPW